MVFGHIIYLWKEERLFWRSDKHLDNSFGPLIIALGLTIALIFNFIFGWKNLNLDPNDEFYNNNPTQKKVHEFMVNMVN